MTDMKRVYHPDLDTYQDVDASAVDDWAEAGWKKTAPKHVTTDSLPPVGEHPGIATVPVLEATSPVTVTTEGRTGTGRATGSGRSSSSSRTAGGSRTGRGAGSAASTPTSGGTSAGSATV